MPADPSGRTDPAAPPAGGSGRFLTAAGEPEVAADRVGKSAGETGASECNHDPSVGVGMDKNNGRGWAGGGVLTQCLDSCGCEVAVLGRDPDRREDSESRRRAAAAGRCVEPYGLGDRLSLDRRGWSPRESCARYEGKPDTRTGEAKSPNGGGECGISTTRAHLALRLCGRGFASQVGFDCRWVVG